MSASSTIGRLKTVEDELAYLRGRVGKKADELGLGKTRLEKERIAHREIQEYAAAPARELLDSSVPIAEHDILHHLLKLEPESHDAQVDGILQLVQTRGVKNALAVAARLKDPHLEDDVHRALVRYVAEGLPTGAETPIFTSPMLHMALLEIRPPARAHDDIPSAQFVAASERLYARLLELIVFPEVFSLEIAIPEGHALPALYMAVPSKKAALVEDLIADIIVGARVAEVRGDYNVFNPSGFHAAAYATSRVQGAPGDQAAKYPMEELLATFAQVAKHGEGAALQLVVSTDTTNRSSPITLLRTWGGKRAQKGSSEKRSASVSMRIVASAATSVRAGEILAAMQKACEQLSGTWGIAFTHVGSWSVRPFLRHFTFREYVPKEAFTLSLQDIAALFHIDSIAEATVPRKRAHVKHVPAPEGLSAEGIVLGNNGPGAEPLAIHFPPAERLHHCYVVGKNESGKSALIKDMALQDIAAGENVMFVSPYESDVEAVLAGVPQARADDVVYFDPTYEGKNIALNLFEYDRARPELKTLVLDQACEIVLSFVSDIPERFGPLFEQYIRNAVLLLLEDQESSTLFDLPRLFIDPEYRADKLSRCQNPALLQFWNRIAGKGDVLLLDRMATLLKPRFDALFSNEAVRLALAQGRSSIKPEVFSEGNKIFVASLSKERLGERESSLLGSVAVAKFLQASFVHAEPSKRSSYVYIDEFHRFVHPSIVSFLSGGEKYGLSFTLAHQFLGELPDQLRESVLPSMGTKVAFRLGTADAETLQTYFAPAFEPKDLETLPSRVAALSLRTNAARSLCTLQVRERESGEFAAVASLKQRSTSTFGTPRREAEEEIRGAFGLPLHSGVSMAEHGDLYR